MYNFKMTISYDGERYNGWQKQGNTENTIQGKLESILSKYFEENIEVAGSGRTDAGVHAMNQIANFKVHENNKNIKTNLNDNTVDVVRIRDEINRYLPKDISIKKVEIVDERFHSRLNANSKHYRYTVDCGAVARVFERKYVYRMEEKPDVELMKSATSYFVGEHDFMAFQANKKIKKSTVRNIEKIDITYKEGILTFDYFGDGFLYNMIRIITGTLLEIGLGKRKIDDIDRIFASRDRSKAGYLVPASGLMLMEVFYD